MSATSSSDPAFVSPPWAGGGGSSSSSSSSGAWCSPQVAELPAPADDDTRLKKTLAALLEGAREIVGRARYEECVRRLRRGEELVVASCLESAEAVAGLCLRKEDLRDRNKKELLKALKKAARDVLLWRCTGSALGLDSREALVRCFEKACRHTNCDENTVSQLTDSYRRIKEELAGGPPTEQRTTVAASPSRSRAPGSVGTTASTTSSSAPAFVSPLWDDDTHLKKTLAALLEGAREIVGHVRHEKCVLQFRRSAELIVASCLESAEALAALGVRKEDLRDMSKKEQLKVAKKAVLDVLLWRCTASTLGLDSEEALVSCFE